MRISKRCQYALRALFELGLHDPSQPIKIHDIAGAQNIPPRFLEIILNQLRHAAFVESQRGSEGGYMLARPAEELTVGEVIQYIQGPIFVTADGEKRAGTNQSFYGDHAFEQLWSNVNSAISQVCDRTTLAELIEYETAKKTAPMPNYSI
jgi:Rrf2 family protein